MLGNSIGLDMGTTNTRIYAKSRGIVLSEATALLVDSASGEVLEVGKQAYGARGKSPGSVTLHCPVQSGVPVQKKETERMLQSFFRKSLNRLLRPTVVAAVPATFSDRHLYTEILQNAGASGVQFIDMAVAAAVGADLDAYGYRGNMVVDIGASKTEVHALSAGHVVVSEICAFGGDVLDMKIQRYMREYHRLDIGLRTAEEIKVALGTLLPLQENYSMEVTGRDALHGTPRMQAISAMEVLPQLQEPFHAVFSRVQALLERTPAELIADIHDAGILLTGGCARLYGLDTLLSEYLECRVRLPRDPLTCTAFGIGKMLENPKIYARALRKPREDL